MWPPPPDGILEQLLMRRSLVCSCDNILGDTEAKLYVLPSFAADRQPDQLSMRRKVCCLKRNMHQGVTWLDHSCWVVCVCLALQVPLKGLLRLAKHHATLKAGTFIVVRWSVAKYFTILFQTLSCGPGSCSSMAAPNHPSFEFSIQKCRGSECDKHIHQLDTSLPPLP